MIAVIDRMEGEFAVLLVGEEEIRVDFPRRHLPQGSKEGSWLQLDIRLDPNAENHQRKKVSGLLQKLKNKHKSIPE